MDVVVTVPKTLWADWLCEGNLPGEAWDGEASHYFSGGPIPRINPRERVYIVAHGKLRGYAPLVKIDLPAGQPWWWERAAWALLRHNGAVACTIPETIPGFRGYRYRWWTYGRETAFPDWQTAGVASQAKEKRYGISACGPI